jgi:hypothetical protein
MFTLSLKQNPSHVKVNNPIIGVNRPNEFQDTEAPDFKTIGT